MIAGFHVTLRMRFTGRTPDNGQLRWMTEDRASEEVAVIDYGQPLHYHVPSASEGPLGIVLDGLTGENAQPWTRGQILAAARNQMFSLRLSDQPETPTTPNLLQ